MGKKKRSAKSNGRKSGGGHSGNHTEFHRKGKNVVEYPENPTINDAAKYIIKLSLERKKLLLGNCRDFFKFVYDYDAYCDDSEDDEVFDVEQFKKVRPQLPFVLEIFRDPREWFVGGKAGTTNIADKSLRCLCDHIGPDLQLSREEMEHLYYIGMISAVAQSFDLCYEVIDKVQETCGRAIGVHYLTEIAFHGGPGRGHLCHKLKNMIMGECISPLSHRAKVLFSWVNSAHVASVCVAIATVLTDIRSSPETNGWCFSAALSILESGKWTAVAAPLLIEPTRVAFLRGKVDESFAGVFSDVLFGTSKGYWLRSRYCKALRTFNGSFMKEEEITTEENLSKIVENSDFDEVEYDFDSDDDNDMKIEDDNESELKWKYFMEQWIRDPRGIPLCKCDPPKPTLRCMHDARAMREKSVKSYILRAREAAKNRNHEEVIALISLAMGEIHICERLPRYRSWLRDARKEAQILRAEALVSLNRLDDALASFEQAHDVDFMPPGSCRPKWPEDGCRRVSDLGIRAIMGSASCLFLMGKYFDAKKRAEEVYSVGPLMVRNKNPESYDDMVEGDTSTLYFYREQAEKLLKRINEKFEASKEKFKSKLKEKQNGMKTNDCDKNVIVGSHPVPITTVVQRFTWKVNGPLENSELSYKDVIVIDRLQWCLIWVKTGILVWDYANSEVVHWLTSIGFPKGSMPELKDPEEIQCVHYIEAPAGGFLMMSTRPNTLFCVVNVDKLMKGARSSMVDALRITLMSTQPLANSIQNPEQWLRRTSTLLGATNCYATCKDGNGNWKMASTSRDSLGVNIFETPGQISFNSDIGPLALTSDTPGLVLHGHDQPVCNMAFVGYTSPIFVTVCYEFIVKVWDISKSSGNNLFSIRGYQSILTKVVCSTSILFAVAFPKKLPISTQEVSALASKDNFEDSLFGSRCIALWSLLDGRRVGTLRAAAGTTSRVMDIVLVPKRTVIVTAHANGELHIWSFSEFPPESESTTTKNSVTSTHYSCFRVLKSSQDGFSLHIQADGLRLYAATIRSMIVLHIDESIFQDSKANSNPKIASGCKDKADDKASNIFLDHQMNCGYCGQWNLEKSCLCSGCKKMHFCDRVCQRKGWADHKELCNIWGQERKLTQMLSSPFF